MLVIRIKLIRIFKLGNKVDKNVGNFLNGVVCRSFVKFQHFHHVNKFSSALMIYA